MRTDQKTAIRMKKQRVYEAEDINTATDGGIYMVRLNEVRESGQVCIITAHRKEMTEIFALARNKFGEGYTVYSPMRG